MSDEWRYGRPPNEEIVEAQLFSNDSILRLKAIYGRDGTRPHWTSEDEKMCWSPQSVRRWRPIPYPAASTTEEE